ncbi:protein timeless homolog isoform X2 [Juglans microcarpa x Juglans regia]|uniref:protein timeless homolog isoform X2 n=1 Tax=Juglans microcarpa x Juglans regia TaxID=2249226 RepID=UPI001B7E24C7|nr:protein timeless homolog isoform X2 [Juglans microcarpa x Juglans regia]
MDTEGLSIICAGLGIVEEDENGNRVGYSKGEYCLDNLKDLLRFLRRDDPQTRDVFKQVCKWNTLSKDLIPIIEHCQDDYNLVLNAVKVLVFLTMPIERTSNDISQQIEYLWQLKSSITCSDVVAVIVSLLESPLESLECETFTEDDWKLVQLVLTLFRNVLAIQEISLQQKSGGSANQFLLLRDRFLELLFRENLMDLILVISQHIDGSCGFLHHDNFLLLEIFHYIFMGQEPELVAKAHLKGFKVDEDTKSSVGSLKSIMEEEEEKRRLSRLRNMVRHSQFSGTFTRLTMDGSKAVLKGNPTSATRDILLKHHNVPRGPVKRIAWDIGRLTSTKDKILELLHDFVSQFLLGAYNVLMQSIREDIEKEHHAVQNNDVMVFFQVAQFVTSFQYHKLLKSKPNVGSDIFETFVDKDADSTIFRGDICGPIAQSMNEPMFQLVILKWRSAFEGLKETNNYKFLSAAGSLMKTMICMLDLVLKLLPEESKEPRTARILLYKLFYDQTDQGITQFLLNLIRMFDTHKQPKSDLADLIEIIHKIVRLMENLQARGTLRVARKSRRKRKKSLSSKETENEQLGDCVTIQNEFGISNNEQSADMSICHQGSRTSTNTNEEENLVIPAPVDEPEMAVSQTRKLKGSLPEMGNKGADQANDDLCHGTDDSSGEEQLDATDEVDFNLSTLISAFANNNIIHRLCWLLKFYKSNSASTNHYIICLLRRITEDLELSPMLYQISILTIFHNILVEQNSCPSKEYENLIDFLKSLVRRMLRKMKIQPLLFVEALFWKTRKECHFINAEYLVHEIGSLKKGVKNWDNVPGDGEIGSSQANRWNVRSIADALGEDEADVVISHELGYQSMEENSDKAGGIKENSDNMSQSMEQESESAPRRKRRLFLGGEMEGKIKVLYEKHSRKRIRAFSEDEEGMIRALYEKFKEHKRCSYMIAKALDSDGKFTAVQVSHKLKQLGLCVPRRKMSEANKHLKDENLNDSFRDASNDSDDETLLSLMNRKAKRSLPQSKLESVTAISIQRTSQSDSGSKASEVDIEWDGSNHGRKLEPAGIDIDVAFSQDSLNGSAEAEVTRSGSGNLMVVAAVNNLDHLSGQQRDDELTVLEDNVALIASPKRSLRRRIGRNGSIGVAPDNLDHLLHQQMDDELADSGDEVAPSVSPKNAVTRRKLRVVLDLEDD